MVIGFLFQTFLRLICKGSKFTSTEISPSSTSDHLGSKDQRHNVEESRKSDSSTPPTLRSLGEGGGQITTRGGVSRDLTTCPDTLIRVARNYPRNFYLCWEVPESLCVQARSRRRLLWVEAAAQLASHNQMTSFNVLWELALNLRYTIYV